MSNLGKSYRGQQHYPVKTPEDVQAEVELRRQYDKPGAVELDVYLTVRGVRNEIERDMRRAYTKVHRATLVDWDEIFKTFG